MVNLNRRSKTDRLFTPEDFMPNYLGDKQKKPVEKSLDQQQKEFSQFKSKYLESTRK